MLEVSGVSKYYGTHCAVEDISFQIEQGEIVGFLGVNGAGKSTTMNIITGYLSATDGDIFLDGIDILTEPLAAKMKIGYLPEQPPVYPDMTVYEYLTFLYDLKKVKKRNLKQSKSEHIQHIMQQVQIEDVRTRIIKNLSKGYKQRVGLAGALIGDPDILILDEPTVGLDPAQIIEIRNLIRSLAQKHTVLLSSHILPEIQAVCNRIIILHEGRIVADDSIQRLAENLSECTSLTADIEGSPEDVVSTLNKITGVTDVLKDKSKLKSDKVNRYEIHISGGLDVRRKIFYTLAEKKLPILSLKGNEKTLEEVFLSLTSGQAVENTGESKESKEAI